MCETFLRRLFFLSAVVAILTTIGIVASLLFEAIRFFREISLIDFFFGTHWSPMTALRPGDTVAIDEDVAGSSGSFGMVPVMLGTLLVALIAMTVAVPIGVFQLSTHLNLHHPGCVGLLNLLLRCWPAFRPWFTGFLRL